MRPIPELSEHFIERFYERLEPRGDCLVWTGYCDKKGYGQVGLGPRKSGTRLTHRIAFYLRHGPIPERMSICHTCDNPPCCNPAHLFLGTLTDNNRDMCKKGRHGHAKRTHCRRGHEYTKENLYLNPNGTKGRQCRVCRAMHNSAWWHRRGKALKASKHLESQNRA